MPLTTLTIFAFMSTSYNTYQEELFTLIEPLFVEHFRNQHGDTPSIIELKQHLVTTNTEKLIEYVKSLNSRVCEIYSHSELAYLIRLYIRKLK